MSLSTDSAELTRSHRKLPMLVFSKVCCRGYWFCKTVVGVTWKKLWHWICKWNYRPTELISLLTTGFSEPLIVNVYCNFLRSENNLHPFPKWLPENPFSIALTPTPTVIKC